MSEIVVLSGKGGTGKTSLTAAFAELAGQAVIADCDVDAADLALVLGGEQVSSFPFQAGAQAQIDRTACNGCGICRARCHFRAITTGEGAIFSIDPLACEGCGVCAFVCPADAIRMIDCIAGHWFITDSAYGALVHARLIPGAENSGKLVTRVRQEAERIAARESIDLRLVDGPPGVGCPVIASCTGADAVVLVTEPSVSGEHDLARVIELIRRFALRAYLIVNRWDLAPELTSAIETAAIAAGVMPIGRIPQDPAFVAAQLRGVPVTTQGGPIAQTVAAIWHRLQYREAQHAAGRALPTAVDRGPPAP
ncbi:MAG: ATP-binding protein [Planctomycetota bacterium]